jgi:hypothetical protein
MTKRGGLRRVGASSVDRRSGPSAEVLTLPGLTAPNINPARVSVSACAGRYNVPVHSIIDQVNAIPINRRGRDEPDAGSRLRGLLLSHKPRSADVAGDMARATKGGAG